MSYVAAIVDRSERGRWCAWLLAIALAGCTADAAAPTGSLDVAQSADAGALPAGSQHGAAAMNGAAGAAKGGTAGASASHDASAAGADAPATSASRGGAPAMNAGGSSDAAGASGSRAGAGGMSGGAAAADGGAGTASPAAGSGGLAGITGAASTGPLTVFVAGDSTVSSYKDTPSPNDQAGWGQMLQDFVRDDVTVDNRAIGGRTARRFIDDGALDKIWNDIKSGDVLLVQFGTNDSNRDATYDLDGQTIPYYLDPETDFKTYLMKYIDGAHQHHATAVLVTPPPRNSAYCTGGNGVAAYAQAMRELASAQQVLLSDLNQQAVEYLKAICPAPDPPDFYLQKADGTVDGTHFQERGAKKLAEFVARGLQQAGVPWVQLPP